MYDETIYVYRERRVSCVSECVRGIQIVKCPMINVLFVLLMCSQ